VDPSVRAALLGTFVLRVATGLTTGLLVFYLADLHLRGGEPVSALTVGLLAAAFFVAELALSPVFGILSDHNGHHRVMLLGPLFGGVAVVITALTTDLWVIAGTRLLEGASGAASVPSVLGFLALATSADPALRGRVSARFEAATVAGVGVGLGAAGICWAVLGPVAFYVDALIYAVSLLILRAARPAGRLRDVEGGGVAPPHVHPGGWRRYLALLGSAHVWLLAPTWIALNAALGLYTSQTLFQLVREPDPRFPDQLLVGGLGPVEWTAGFAVAGLVFFAGLAWWGERFRELRRTSIISFGVVGGAVVALAAIGLNHSGGWPLPVQLLLVAAALAGLWVLAGATPAALGLLADLSEAFPHDRGAIMGVYSVFLGAGQISGLVLGGVVADVAALDGILAATLVLMGVALLPLAHLRHMEPRLLRRATE
jgi:MFS family permease